MRKKIAVVICMGVFLVSISHAAVVGLWHFDEGTGTTTADASGNGNTAVLGGPGADGENSVAPTWVSPGYDGTGYALDYSVPDDAAVVQHNASLDTLEGATGSNAMTAQMWVKFNSAVHNGTILDKNTYKLYTNVVGSDYVLKMQMIFCNEDDTNMGSVSFVCTTNIPLNEWHKVAFSYDGTYIRVYVDDVIDTTFDVVNALGGVPAGIRSFDRDEVPDTPSRPLAFGNGNIPLNRAIDGQIDEVQIDDEEILWEPVDCAEAISAGLGVPGDVNQDCKVNIDDLLGMIAEWLGCDDPAGC